MVTVDIFVERPVERMLHIDCESSPGGLLVPRFTRGNLARLIIWLWEFDPEAGPEQGGATEPYLLDDAYLLLQGGIFSIAYPTDYGKSTLVDVDTVCSLLFWPEETLNLIIKRAADTAVKAAQGCAFKLKRASEHFPYARPMCRWDPSTGMPMVKDGFWIEGSRLRAMGERNRSVYPAGIGAVAIQGMRGRTKLDDLEDENTLKSAAKTDTLHKNVNNAVRGLESAKDNALWAIFGTPQGAASVMHVVDKDLTRMGRRYRIIRRPRIIAEGPNAGKLLFPARESKYEMQSGIMDPGALRIAYDLVELGAGQFDADFVLTQIRDRHFPRPRNEAELREYLYARLVQDARSKGHGGNEVYVEAQRLVAEDLSIFGNWDPATTGTYAISLLAALPRSFWLLDFHMDTETSDQQADRLLEWQAFFPSITFVIERDGTQDSFIDLLRLKDPNVMVVPHLTHAQNKNVGHTSIPSMMKEMGRPGVWHFPWANDDAEEYFALLVNEIRRWGPVSHPHGIPSLWFGWHYDKQTRVNVATDTPLDVTVGDVVILPSVPALRDPSGRLPAEPEPRWKRWPRPNW